MPVIRSAVPRIQKFGGEELVFLPGETKDVDAALFAKLVKYDIAFVALCRDGSLALENVEDEIAAALAPPGTPAPAKATKGKKLTLPDAAELAAALTPVEELKAGA